MLSDEILAEVVEFLHAEAAKDDAQSLACLKIKQPHSAYTFNIRAETLRAAATRLIEHHKKLQPKETPCASQ
jgi:hypothetical protein